jgi:DNA-binding phage protein
MALTVDYKEGVLKDLRENPEMAREFYREAVRSIINGDIETGGVMLRDLVNAGIGFQRLARETGIRAPNLHRALSPEGNPTMKTFGKIAAAISAFMGFNSPMSAFS